MRAWSAVGVALVPLGLGLACGSSDVASPFTPSFPKSTGGKAAMPSGGEGGAAPHGSGGREAAGGSAGMVEMGGSAGDPGPGSGGKPEPSCELAPPGPHETFSCGPSLRFGESSALPFGSAAVLAVTPDQKVLLARGASPLGDYFFLAERPDTSSDFGPPLDLAFTEYPAALSPDGLRLIVISEDRTALAEITRTTIGEPFSGSSDATRFAAINERLDDLDQIVIHATMAPDDLGIAYATYDAIAQGSRVHWSARPSLAEAFSPGHRLSGCAFDGADAQTILPTSLTADGLGLFLYDEIRGRALLAHRDSLSADFETFASFEENSRIFVNGACDSALFSAPFGNAQARIAPIESR